MVNILNSLKHSVSETVPLVRGEWKHSHRAHWAQPKHWHSKITSDWVETSNRKCTHSVCVIDFVCVNAATHTHTHTPPSVAASRCCSRRCFKMLWVRSAVSQQQTQTNKEQKQQLGRDVDRKQTCLQCVVFLTKNMEWKETNYSGGGSSGWCLIRACRRKRRLFLWGRGTIRSLKLQTHTHFLIRPIFTLFTNMFRPMREKSCFSLSLKCLITSIQTGAVK